MTYQSSSIIFSLVLCCLAIVGSEDRKCQPNDLTKLPCGENEMCVAKKMNSGVCQCLLGYVRSPNECVLNVTASPSRSPSSPGHAEMVHQSSVSSGTITAAVLVPLMLAACGLLAFVGRRYKWLERIQLLQGRRYEEVRIGQEDDDDDDDPPLA